MRLPGRVSTRHSTSCCPAISTSATTRVLEKEFDKIVDGVRDLEQVALREGDGFTEQRSEPAPIDEANDITFPVDPSSPRQGRGRNQDHQV